MRDIIRKLGGVKGIYKQMKRSGYFKWYDDMDANLGIVRSIRGIRPLMFVMILLSTAITYDPYSYRRYLMKEAIDLSQFELDDDELYNGFEFLLPYKLVLIDVAKAEGYN